MADVRLVAAILTVAVNASKPRINNVSDAERGNADWQLVVKQYKQFLDILRVRNKSPEQAKLYNNGDTKECLRN